MNTGLQQGELLGLRWEDLDLDTATLRVRRTLQNGEFYPPKSGKGRNVKLTGQTVDALRAHRKRQLEERTNMAELWGDQELVFPNRVGKPLDHNNLYQRDFKKLLKRAGLSLTFRFHDLRHTCATLLVSRNVNPTIVQEMLGDARSRWVSVKPSNMHAAILQSKVDAPVARDAPSLPADLAPGYGYVFWLCRDPLQAGVDGGEAP